MKQFSQYVDIRHGHFFLLINVAVVRLLLLPPVVLLASIDLLFSEGKKRHRLIDKNLNTENIIITHFPFEVFALFNIYKLTNYPRLLASYTNNILDNPTLVSALSKAHLSRLLTLSASNSLSGPETTRV